MSPSEQFRQAFKDRRACVTGGAGFIGSHLCEALVGHGAQVSVIDDLSNGREDNLRPLGDDVVLHVGSILDEPLLDEAVGGADVVFHLAAVASVPRSVREPQLYERINTTGTVRVLEAARRAGARRVVFASSSSVYGDQPVSPKVETMRPDPLSPYAAAKGSAEQFVRAYACCYELSTISLRYFNVFGPRQRVDSPYAAVIPKFVDAIRHGRRPLIYGDGTQTRDFTHVANAVHANLLAGSCPRTLQGEVVNVAAGEGRTVLELLERIAEQAKVAPDYDTAPPRPGEVLHSRADLSAARELIGYEPIMPFAQGLAQTVRHYLDTLVPSAS